MSRPKIRHLAMYALNPDQLARFYVTVFDMEIVLRAGPAGKGPVFLSDGYMNLALLPATTTGEATVGLNHIGFHVDNVDAIAEQLVAAGMDKPTKRPAGRYAEYRATDPCGNAFDLSEHGFQEDDAARQRRKAAGIESSAGEQH
jgi:predicted enzyme related to lactoylglutathione lyase